MILEVEVAGKLAAHRPQARLDVAETLAVSELSESHRQMLIPARRTSVVMIAIIASHTLLELDVGEVSNQLRENGSAGIHPPLFRLCGTGASSPFRPDPAHFHAEYGEYEALIEVETLSVLRGEIPRRAMALVLEWASLHRYELTADWERARAGTLLESIAPLD